MRNRRSFDTTSSVRAAFGTSTDPRLRDSSTRVVWCADDRAERSGKVAGDLVKVRRDRVPVQCREVCLDVVALGGWCVIDQIRMFPMIDRKQDRNSGKLADLVVGDPGVQELLLDRVVVQDRPPGTSRADVLEYLEPLGERAVLLHECDIER